MSGAPSPLAAITGAYGWLGSCMARFFRERGWSTRGLVRRPALGEAFFALGAAPAPEALEGVDALIHCAYDFAPRTEAEIERVNVRGSEQLFQAAQRAGLRKLVYISTMSAYPGCVSLYGRAKLATEQIAADFGAFIVRPGLIAGENAGGMLGQLERQVENGRVLPLIAGEAILYAIQERDLCDLIFRFCAGEFPAPAAPVTAAHPRPWPFRELLGKLAQRRGRKPIFVPVPWRGVWMGLRAAELLGAKLGFRSDSVLSLARQNPAPDLAAPPELHFAPAPLFEE